MHYKLNITKLPVYKDGSFVLFNIVHTEDTYPKEVLEQAENNEYFYEELSLTDNIIFENEKRDKKIKLKIRIPQDKSITSTNVLKINGDYLKVFNIYHFKNQDGIMQSDITLEEYPNPKLRGEINE